MGGKNSGRSQYNAAVHEEIVSALKLGASRAIAASNARISRFALNSWIERGLAGDALYQDLATDVEAAEAHVALRSLAVIARAAVQDSAGDWKAAAWLLERKYPLEFGARVADMAYLTSKGVEKVHSPWKQTAPHSPATPRARRRLDA